MNHTIQDLDLNQRKYWYNDQRHIKRFTSQKSTPRYNPHLKSLINLLSSRYNTQWTRVLVNHNFKSQPIMGLKCPISLVRVFKQSTKIHKHIPNHGPIIRVSKPNQAHEVKHNPPYVQSQELGFECTNEYHVVFLMNQGPKDQEIGVLPHMMSNTSIPKKKPNFIDHKPLIHDAC